MPAGTRTSKTHRARNCTVNDEDTGAPHAELVYDACQLLKKLKRAAKQKQRSRWMEADLFSALSHWCEARKAYKACRVAECSKRTVWAEEGCNEANGKIELPRGLQCQRSAVSGVEPGLQREPCCRDDLGRELGCLTASHHSCCEALNWAVQRLSVHPSPPAGQWRGRKACVQRYAKLQRHAEQVRFERMLLEGDAIVGEEETCHLRTDLKEVVRALSWCVQHERNVPDPNLVDELQHRRLRLEIASMTWWQGSLTDQATEQARHRIEEQADIVCYRWWRLHMCLGAFGDGNLREQIDFNVRSLDRWIRASSGKAGVNHGVSGHLAHMQELLRSICEIAETLLPGEVLPRDLASRRRGRQVNKDVLWQPSARGVRMQTELVPVVSNQLNPLGIAALMGRPHHKLGVLLDCAAHLRDLDVLALACTATCFRELAEARAWKSICHLRGQPCAKRSDAVRRWQVRLKLESFIDPYFDDDESAV
mmetsp:Transcript_8103/g.14940  ORF Transcript_8103/g.14940 Transcript_8103/m.14940 type:complete len:480 (+) Transcript_8103:49-1488(+)